MPMWDRPGMPGQPGLRVQAAVPAVASQRVREDRGWSGVAPLHSSPWRSPALMQDEWWQLLWFAALGVAGGTAIISALFMAKPLGSLI